MKIAIVIHSETGNTLQVAEGLQRQLLGEGHEVELLRLATKGEKPAPGSPVTLQTIPDVSAVDGLIIGAPVWAFALSPVMRAWLEQMKAAPGLPAAVFLTHALPMRWLGARRGLNQAVSSCEQKSLHVIDTGLVWCGRRPHAGQLQKLSDSIQQQFRSRE